MQQMKFLAITKRRNSGAGNRNIPAQSIPTNRNSKERNNFLGGTLNGISPFKDAELDATDAIIFGHY